MVGASSSSVTYLYDSEVPEHNCKRRGSGRDIILDHSCASNRLKRINVVWVRPAHHLARTVLDGSDANKRASGCTYQGTFQRWMAGEREHRLSNGAVSIILSLGACGEGMPSKVHWITIP
jgi:hypothetical protein